jgi:hypothetical protein
MTEDDVEVLGRRLWRQGVRFHPSAYPRVLCATSKTVDSVVLRDALKQMGKREMRVLAYGAKQPPAPIQELLRLRTEGSDINEVCVGWCLFVCGLRSVLVSVAHWLWALGTQRNPGAVCHSSWRGCDVRELVPGG